MAWQDSRRREKNINNNKHTPAPCGNNLGKHEINLLTILNADYPPNVYPCVLCTSDVNKQALTGCLGLYADKSAHLCTHLPSCLWNSTPAERPLILIASWRQANRPSCICCKQCLTREEKHVLSMEGPAVFAHTQTDMPLIYVRKRLNKVQL